MIRTTIALTSISMMTFLAACDQGPRSSGTPLSRAWESPEPQGGSGDVGGDAPGSTTSTRPAAESTPSREIETIAEVNGEPIDKAELFEMLVESHGVDCLEQLILLTAGRQKLREQSLVVTELDIRAAHAEALRRLSTPIVNPGAPPLTREQAERLLEQFLAAKRISRREWDARMEQRAMLRKLARASIEAADVSEELLRKEYELAYGEKVQVRHIQVGSLARAAEVRAELAEGRDFELLARQMSENEFTAAQGGLTRPFTRDDPGVTPLMREVAFRLEPGQVSDPVRDGEVYHVIRMERRFPPSGVGFENANREELRQRVLERLIAQREQELELELLREADVEIRHPELAREFAAKRGGE